jgi:tripartite-type tricarboxylate transporter receptor subunit TctC
MQSQAMLAKLLLSCSVLLSLSTPAAAQAPSPKNITIIVPYATGGATDIVARIVAQQLGGRLGTPVIVENRQGGGGVVGWNAAARAAADGNTLLAMEMSYSISAGLTPNLPYDPKTAFVPINTAVSVGPWGPCKKYHRVDCVGQSRTREIEFWFGWHGHQHAFR